MKIWTYRRRFKIDDIAGEVTTVATFKDMTSTLLLAGQVVAVDVMKPSRGAPLRNNHLNHTLADGRSIEIEAGYVGWWKTQIAVRVDGVLRYESAPGATIAWPAMFGKTYGKGQSPSAEEEQQVRDEETRQREQFRRNKPSLIVDISIGLLFFVVAKLTNLTTAALVSAGAGIVVAIVQRVTKIDLLGGLAAFGIVMSLITAGFAWAFQDDEMVKMRTTILGLLTAFLFLGDGLFGGRYLGRRLVRYMPNPDTHAGRLAIGLGATGVVMAVLNLLVARLFSTDIWLVYHTFLDTFVAIGLTLYAIKYAQPKEVELEAKRAAQ